MRARHLAFISHVTSLPNAGSKPAKASRVKFLDVSRNCLKLYLSNLMHIKFIRNEMIGSTCIQEVLTSKLKS